jgi:hypothetical protein
LITGILPPLSGGFTFISESIDGGGQSTPFESDSLSPSGFSEFSPDLGCAGAQLLSGGGGAGLLFWPFWFCA